MKQVPEGTILKNFFIATLILVTLATPAFASVTVSSPANGATVSSPVQYVATATTSTCSKGVASMGVYVNNQLIVVQNGTSLNKPVSLAPGKYNTVLGDLFALSKAPELCLKDGGNWKACSGSIRPCRWGRNIDQSRKGNQIKFCSKQRHS